MKKLTKMHKMFMIFLELNPKKKKKRRKSKLILMILVCSKIREISLWLSNLGLVLSRNLQNHIIKVEEKLREQV